MRRFNGGLRTAQEVRYENTSRKYRAGKDPLERENMLSNIEPLESDQVKQMTAILEKEFGGAKATAEQKNALAFWKMQISSKTADAQAKLEFLRGFYMWLLGRGSEEDTSKTRWGRANAAAWNPEVAAYIDQFTDKRANYALKLNLLSMRQPATLNEYYLYYKYIVNGKLQRIDRDDGTSYWDMHNDDYLEDFDIFKQAFDLKGEREGYANLVRPQAMRPRDKKAFDSVDPYPVTRENMENGKLVDKVQAFDKKQATTNAAEELRDEMDIDKTPGGLGDAPNDEGGRDAPPDVEGSNQPGAPVYPNAQATEEANNLKSQVHTLTQELETAVGLAAKTQNEFEAERARYQKESQEQQRTAAEMMESYQAQMQDQMKKMEEEFAAREKELRQQAEELLQRIRDLNLRPDTKQKEEEEVETEETIPMEVEAEVEAEEPPDIATIPEEDFENKNALPLSQEEADANAAAAKAKARQDIAETAIRHAEQRERSTIEYAATLEGGEKVFDDLVRTVVNIKRESEPDTPAELSRLVKKNTALRDKLRERQADFKAERKTIEFQLEKAWDRMTFLKKAGEASDKNELFVDDKEFKEKYNEFNAQIDAIQKRDLERVALARQLKLYAERLAEIAEAEQTYDEIAAQLMDTGNDDDFIMKVAEHVHNRPDESVQALREAILRNPAARDRVKNIYQSLLKTGVVAGKKTKKKNPSTTLSKR